MLTLLWVGVMLPNLDASKKSYVAVLQTSADGKGHQDYVLAKKAVSALTERFCRKCNCTSAKRSVPFDTACSTCSLLLNTLQSHERDIMLVGENPEFSRMLGASQILNACFLALSSLVSCVNVLCRC